MKILDDLEKLLAGKSGRYWRVLEYDSSEAGPYNRVCEISGSDIYALPKSKVRINFEDEEKNAALIVDAVNNLPKLIGVIEMQQEALIWIADKKTDTSSAHSMRSIKKARDTIAKVEEKLK